MPSLVSRTRLTGCPGTERILIFWAPAGRADPDAIDQRNRIRVRSRMF